MTRFNDVIITETPEKTKEFEALATHRARAIGPGGVWPQLDAPCRLTK